LDYTYGIGKICTQEEIKQSPSFGNDLKYLGEIGKVFHANDIEALNSEKQKK
jgi:hypothetical protein